MQYILSQRQKNPVTIRLAKMNLAVHGLEGNIQKAITYYEDSHQMTGEADFVMSNPPFNVDEVDAEKIKNDPRLPFGLPGVNKKGAVSNGNYLWISYFYSYLNEHGRAGFVMSSQASSAGGGEAKVRQKLIETGYVDAVETLKELRGCRTTFKNDDTTYNKALNETATAWKSSSRDNAGLRQSAQRLAPISEQSRDLVRQVDLLFKLVKWGLLQMEYWEVIEEAEQEG